ncbi:MAG: PTS system mannose/fructose/sorbose family transporter subunit IID [Chloroflexi bacterium]|nr:PTS system mannose/fructose/sorbose family transporter subunit IID [Chloroflexota bacterium]
MQQLDFYGGLVAAFAAAGWQIIFHWLPQFIPVLSQKENKTLAWWLAAMAAIRNTLTKSQVATAFLVGLLLGRPLEGLAVGAVIELMFLGVFVVGASIPPQPYLATIMTTVFVIRAGLQTADALALVMPVAILSQTLMMAALSWNHLPLGIAKRRAEEGDFRGVDIQNTAWQVTSFSIAVNLVPAFIGGFVGVPAVQAAVQWLQTNAGWVLEGMGFLAGVLPALGFALLLYQMGTRLIGYLFLGIVAAIYLKPDPLALALAGVGLALVHMLATRREEGAPTTAVSEAPARPARELKLTDEDILAMYWRHWNLFQVASWEVLGGLGFAQTMVPVIRRFYKTKEEISAALKRHMVFYNTNPWLGAIIPGVLASMEEERANGQPVDEAAIQGVKVAMMGPFAGVGDSLFWATYIPIILAITASWAQSGNTALMWLAPITVLVVLGLSNLLIPYYFMRFGYRRGLSALQDLQQRNLLAELSTAATVVGQFVVGGLVVKLVNLQVRWAPSFFGTSPIQLQKILDSIMPSLLPLLIFFFAYWLLRRGKSAIFVMVVLMIICLVGAYPIPLPLFNNASILGKPIEPEQAKTSLLLLRQLFIG